MSIDTSIRKFSALSGGQGIECGIKKPEMNLFDPGMIAISEPAPSEVKGEKLRKKFLIILLVFLPICLFGCSADEEGGLVKDLIGRFSNDTEKYLKDLKSENTMVRKKAINYLGEKRTKAAVPLIIEILNMDQSKAIRLSSIVALGNIGESSSVEALIELLKERDDEIRNEAIRVLGSIKDPRAVRPLLDILYDKDVQLTVIWALGNIGEKSTVPVLTRLLSHEDKFVRYNAAQSLKKIR